MKRVISLLCAAVLVTATLASCKGNGATDRELNENEKTAYEKYAAAYELTKAEDSLQMKVSSNLDIGHNNTLFEYSIKASGTSGDAVITDTVRSSQTDYATAPKSTVGIFADREYTYITPIISDSTEFKVKTGSAADMYSVLPIVNLKNVKLGEKAFINVTQTEENGNMTYKFNMPTDMFVSSFGEYIKSVLGNVDYKPEQISDAEYSLTVNHEGYISAVSVSFKAVISFEMMGVMTEYSISSALSAEYHSYGESLDLSRPSGHENYPEQGGSGSSDVEL